MPGSRIWSRRSATLIPASGSWPRPGSPGSLRVECTAAHRALESLSKDPNPDVVAQMHHVAELPHSQAGKINRAVGLWWSSRNWRSGDWTIRPKAAPP